MKVLCVKSGRLSMIVVVVLSFFVLHSCKQEEPEKELIIDFSATQSDIAVGDTIGFHPSSNYSMVNFHWTFSGGTPDESSNPTPAVIYNTPGQYAVSLTVIAYPDGPTSTKTKQQFITVH